VYEEDISQEEAGSGDSKKKKQVDMIDDHILAVLRALYNDCHWLASVSQSNK